MNLTVIVSIPVWMDTVLVKDPFNDMSFNISLRLRGKHKAMYSGISDSRHSEIRTNSLQRTQLKFPKYSSR